MVENGLKSCWLVNDDEFSKALYCGQSSLLPLPIIWMRELSTPSVSLNIECVGGVIVPEGSKALQKNMERLVWWLEANSKTFNKTKWQILHLGYGKPVQCYRRGAEHLESGPARIDLGVLDSWLNMSQPAPSGQEGQWHPDLCHKKCGQQDQSSDCSPHHWWGSTSNIVFDFGPFSSRNIWMCWSRSREVQRSWSNGLKHKS